MKTVSLEQKMQQAGGAVEMLRHAQTGPYQFPIQPEFSNWRDEQEAWATTAVLFDQSLHMTDLYVEGPDTVRLLTALGINSFQNWGRNKAKQFVACNYDGYVIGDAILFGLEADRVSLVGRPPVCNWVQFHAETGGYDVTVERDERSLQNPQPRKTYRFEVQGPNAWQILERANGGPIAEMKFFAMGEISIAGRRVRCLRHGMSGAPGLELWGPVEEGPEIRAALIEAGREFGLRLAGGRAYSTTAMESGWIPSPMPAIYSGDKMKPYREWLSDRSFEANASLGGSFYSDNIEDYYLTPWDLGYHFVKFDHDFIGREALERMVERPHMKKVSLVWDVDDVMRVIRSQYNAGNERYKFMEWPAAQYATLPYDRIMADGRRVGISTYPVYNANARCWYSLAMIEPSLAEPGARVSVVWGEEEGGSRKPNVERHQQTEINATVAPSPFSKTAREQYRPYTRK